MLLDNVPHECYGRIKLCRTMIQVRGAVLMMSLMTRILML